MGWSLAAGWSSRALRKQPVWAMSWVPLLGVVLLGGVLPSGGALQAQDAIEVLIDNDDEGTSSVGDWSLSRRGTNFGPDGRVSANNSEGNTYTFDFELPKSGDYEVFLWWTTRFFSASSNVPVDIVHEDGTTTVFVDQRANGGKWNRIGTHLFSSKGSVTVRAPDSRRTTVDGLRLLRVGNERPEPTIVEITPNPANDGESVRFVGEGSDEDGNVIAYAWNSSIDGQLSEDAVFSTRRLTVGQHEISFRVQDDDLQWSEAATALVSIEAEIPNEVPTATIEDIDPSPAVEGDTISFDGKSSDADGDVIAWAWASSIEGDLSDDEDFATASLSVGEHEITFRVQDNDLTWSEVASTLLRVDALPNVPPTSTIKEIDPSPAAVGEEIFFNGSSNDPDGQVSARRWNSSLDGQLSTKQDFVSSSLSIGVHEILYEVRDNDGEWSDGARTMLEVFEPLEAEIVLESLEASGGLVPPGALEIQVKILSSSPTPLEVGFAGRRVGTDEEFTVVVLPDTQNYVDSGKHPEVFTAQTQWIVDNKETENIVFVSHAGDVVDHADSQLEWDLANESMSLLDGVLPYGISPGNHDQDIHLDLPEGATGTLYPDYFPASRFENENWYGGNFPAGTNWNSYQLISAGGVDFIFLHVQFCPSADEVAWADAVLKGHSERRAILITHGFIDEFGNRAVGHCDDTQYIWDGIVVPNENLEILLCAHMKTEHLRTDLVGERRVYQILANYQKLTDGGSGWLRILRFFPAEDRIDFKTYSPWVDDFRIGPTSEFSLDFSMRSFETFGSVGDVTDGASVSAVWSELAPETQYEWFAFVTDESGRRLEGPRWTFTTSSGEPTASVLSVEPNPAEAGVSVQFEGFAEDPDGEVVNYLWESDLDGPLSGEPFFAVATLSVGTHTVSLSAQDDAGTWSEPVAVEVVVTEPPPPTAPPEVFRRGDANLDSVADLSDGVSILNHLFSNEEPFGCPDAADSDDSGDVDISDAIRLFAFLFLGGQDLPAPGPFDCGVDNTSDDVLGCADQGNCEV